jgi:putative hydrolase of the HAD superfamily
VHGAVGHAAAETDDHGIGSIRRGCMQELGSPNTGPAVKWYRGRVPLRAIFFDAGNTLVRIDYAAIAAALAARGVSTTPEALMRAEWRARVRLDTAMFATGEVASTEERTTHSRYLAYVLEGIGVTDAALVDAMDAWRRGYNQPVGIWTAPEPDAVPALTLARTLGLRTGVISNSNGTIKRILTRLALLPLVDFALDSSEEGVEKPQPAIFERALARAGVIAAEAAYVGDLYSIDVLGARRAGLRAVLLDPGGCWGGRDCPTAGSVLGAVKRLLACT